MENRAFSAPDVRFDSEIEFCRPSWNRKGKYVSLNHWLTTKAAPGRREKDQRTLRYKLYETGYYAGAIILEVGVSFGSSIAVALRAAKEAGHDVQYFGIDEDSLAIAAAESQLSKKKLDSRALFFEGSLAEFRNIFQITPTMVIVNTCEDTETVLKHLALFLAKGTPVLVTKWFENRADHRSAPRIDGFDYCGRFSESVLLHSSTQSNELPGTFSEDEFQKVRQEFAVKSRREASRNRDAVRSLLFDDQNSIQHSEKKWPFAKNSVNYPKTLPDGTPWPKISIVTPTFNQGKYIEQTINSIINQDYPNLEYIVVDGGSTDETQAILQRYQGSIDRTISEQDEGQSDAINKGMDLTSGEILTWLNSDDMLAPGTLFAMAMAFWKSKADMVVGTVQLLQGDRIVGEHLTSCENGPLQLSELLDLDNNWLQGRFFFQPELMFTRDLWDRAGGYVDKSLYYSMDHELWLRFAIAGANMHIIGRPTVIFRMHDEQKTNDDYKPELRTVNRRYIEKYGVPKSRLTSLESKKYRVAFVNDVGSRYGAGIAHGRLRDAMAAAGHDNVFICAKPTDSETKTASELYLEIEQFDPDLVVFGNLHNAGIGIDLVDHVAERWATCFVMHDLWAVTGRCFYPSGCTKHLAGCDAACPTASQYPAMQPEHIAPAFEHKLNVISKPRKVVLMANSEWTRREAEISTIGSKGVIKKSKLAFPTHIFEPRDKNMCREILGLPKDKFIVLFASVNISDERKGLCHLFEALNRLDIEDLLPVCIGHASGPSTEYPGTVSMGYVEDPWRAALIYAAADIFVGPSLHEAFGQVFVESAACGTPAVAYATGGVSEAINDGVTGLLARQIHPAGLAAEINRLYADPQYRRDLAVWGRIEIENEWSLRSAYRHFNNLLREVPEHIGFLPPVKIAFDPVKSGGILDSQDQVVSILERGCDKVTYGTGFCPPEDFQNADGSTCLVRWAMGNRCEVTVRVSKPGLHGIKVRCMNPCEAQKIDVQCNGKLVNSIVLDHSKSFNEPHELQLVSNVSTGVHELSLICEKTFLEPGCGRELSLLLIDVTVEPESNTIPPFQLRAA